MSVEWPVSWGPIQAERPILRDGIPPQPSRQYAQRLPLVRREEVDTAQEWEICMTKQGDTLRPAVRTSMEGVWSTPVAMRWNHMVRRDRSAPRLWGYVGQ